MDGFLEAISPKPKPDKPTAPMTQQEIVRAWRIGPASPPDFHSPAYVPPPKPDLDAAIELLRSMGYTVTKPKPRAAKCAVPVLNAVGKPYGANYDPKYRVKYRTPRAPYGQSTAANGGVYEYRQAIMQKYAGNDAMINEILCRNGVK